MRVTLSIDDELARALEDLAKRTSKPLKQVVNETLRAGLSTTGARPSKPYRVKPTSLGGAPPGIDLDRTLGLADAIEEQELALSGRLTDDLSRTILRGAVQAAIDANNPIRGNLFAGAIRELFSYLLHELAPDNAVKQCSWFQAETDNGRPTRAQRQRYLIQGGLDDVYVRTELKLDVDDSSPLR